LSGIVPKQSATRTAEPDSGGGYEKHIANRSLKEPDSDYSGLFRTETGYKEKKGPFGMFTHHASRIQHPPKTGFSSLRKSAKGYGQGSAEANRQNAGYRGFSTLVNLTQPWHWLSAYYKIALCHISIL